MPVTNVKTKWIDGNLVFYDVSMNEIATWDGTNRKFSIPSGSELEVDGVTVDESTLAMTGLTASAPELNEQVLTMDVLTDETTGDFYIIAPHAGTIDKIYTVIDAAIADADITVTASIAGAAVTGGAVTIAYSGSAAGDIDVVSPTAAKTITAGAAIKLVVAGGTTGGGDKVHIAIVITR